MVEFMPRGQSANAASYHAALKWLRRAIQNGRRGQLSTGVVLLHDNARPHSAASTRALLAHLCWDFCPPPPSSPQSGPSSKRVSFVHTHLKQFLGGMRMGNEEEVKTVKYCLNGLAFFFLVSWGGLRLSPLGTSATVWPIVPAPEDRWWVWSNWWNENWQRKPKYSEKTCRSATLSTTNRTWADLGSNLGHRGGKPATNRLSYGTWIDCIIPMKLRALISCDEFLYACIVDICR
jgi:hypothetical protein